MICKEVHKKLNAYLSSELDKSQQAEFEMHLNDCTSCRHLLNEVQQSMQLAEEPKVLEADPFMFTRIQAKLQPSTQSTPFWKRALQPAAISMIMVLGIMVGVALGSKYYNDSVLSSSDSTENVEQGEYFNEMAYETIELYLITE